MVTPPLQQKKSAFGKQPNVVGSILSEGGIISEKYSTVKLTATTTTMKFFGNDEASKGYPEYAKYNFQGKNPLDSQTGKTLAFKLEVLGPDFTPLDLSAGVVQFDVYKEVNQLLHQLAFEFKLNKNILREPIAKSFADPIPHLIFPKVYGSGVANGVSQIAVINRDSNNLENERGILRLPLNLGQGDALEVNAKLPNAVGPSLVNHLLVLNLLAVEFKAKDQ